MNNRTILLIGNKSLIGAYLNKYFKKTKKQNYSLDKKDNIDLKNRKQLENYLKRFKAIDYIVNASGKNDHITKDQKVF